jgi:phage shock protein PspC (stress-responsive transcriptional regulator)
MGNVESSAEDQLDAMLRDGRISPEDYDTLHRALSQGPPAEAALPRRTGKKLRKTRRGLQLGGVCAGLAEYFELDAWSIRAVFVLAALMTGGTAVVAYLVLYFTLPWAEDEEVVHSGKGTSGFAMSLVALWAFGLFFSFLVVPSLRDIIAMLRLSGSLVTWLTVINHVLWATWIGLFAQVPVLGLLYLMYMGAPRNGLVRRWLPRLLVAMVLVYVFAWAYVVMSTVVRLPS